MYERQRALWFSALIMVVISVVVIVVVIALLYTTAFEGQRVRLREMVRGQVRLLEAVLTAGQGADVALRIMQDAHADSKEFGETGEFSLARLDGKQIVFLLPRRHASALSPTTLETLPPSTSPIARALLGQAGSMLGIDYRGARVLAAYEPVSTLRWGIVAKIDLREVRAPFVRAGLYAVGGSLAIILGGIFLLYLITNPLMQRLAESEARHHAILETAPDGVIITDAEGTVLSFNSAAEQLFGYTVVEVIGQPVSLLMPTPSHVGYNGVLEVMGRHRDGSLFPLDMTISDMRLGEQRLVTRIVRNTTERKAAEEALKQAYNSLESWVAERTADLRRANEQLQREIIERIHIEAALRSSRERLHDLATHLQTLQEEERRRIAREIHDELGQGLTGLNIDVAWLTRRSNQVPAEWQERLQAMSALIATLIHAVRRIGTSLRPSVLDDLGLIAAIESQLQDVQRRMGLAYELIVPSEDILLDPERTIAVFRIFQAALTNVVLHAEASLVTVRVTQQPAAVLLEVMDNGRGITSEQIADPTSLGLLGMRERASLWGGDVVFAGQPGMGTTVRVHMPRESPEELDPHGRSPV